jgi:hypothetical protein
MADVIETVDKAETLGIIVGMIVIGYVLYTWGSQIGDWITNLTGASPQNSYSNAATQTVQHPITTLGSIIGIGQGSSAPSTNLPTQTSSTGYQKVGTSGQVWNCTGPQGAPNDVCYPVTLDGSGNPTITGAAVQAVNAN